MSKASQELRLKRITVAFAAAESQSRAIDAIARLAADYQAEVLGVFIEDADMLRAARLPFALELCRATNLVRPADSGEIERALRERAALARKLVEETAERSGGRWSFEVVRQRKASAVLELAKGTDVTVFAAAASYHYRGRTAAGEQAPAPHPPAGESIVVLVDRSAASRRAVQIAQSLAARRRLPVQALVIAATQASLKRLTGLLHSTTRIDASRIRELCRPQFRAVADAASALHPAALVLPIDLVAAAPEHVHELEEALDNPILIVK